MENAPSKPLSTALDAWRREQGLTLTDLGRRYGVSAAQAWRHCQAPGAKQQKIPRPALMSRIYVMTRGAVTPNDFYDLPDLPELQEQAA